MRHPTSEAILKFNKIFNIDESSYSQDWEIEAADPSMVEEYIACYNTNTANDDERFTLMALILGAFEEYHTLENPKLETWESIKKILLSHKGIHKDHILYYQCNEAESDDEFFPITKLIREVVV